MEKAEKLREGVEEQLDDVADKAETVKNAATDAADKVSSTVESAKRVKS